MAGGANPTATNTLALAAVGVSNDAPAMTAEMTAATIELLKTRVIFIFIPLSCWSRACPALWLARRVARMQQLESTASGRPT
jgi:hypothetical protein